MEKIGIDVHKVATQACILTDDGEFVEFRIRTERDALTQAFASRARTRILLEAATESEWAARHLELLGHEVIVADPNFAPMRRPRGGYRVVAQYGGLSASTRRCRRCPTGCSGSSVRLPDMCMYAMLGVYIQAGGANATQINGTQPGPSRGHKTKKASAHIQAHARQS
jgi:hypothetical protein